MKENDDKSDAIQLDEPGDFEENLAPNESVEEEDNDQEFSGNELSEADEIYDDFSGNELDESDEDFSGNELDESDESEEDILGNELDESDESDEDLLGNESDGNDEGLSGNKPGKSISDPQPAKDVAKLFKGKSKLAFLFAFVLVFLSGVGYFFIKINISPETSNQKDESKQVEKFVIPKDQIIVLDSFVIPFEQSTKFTYISLAIAFKCQGKELMEEMIREKGRVRGIIYDILSTEINELNDVPPLDSLKDVIIKSVNGFLSAGKINEAYITNLIAV